MTDKRLVLTTTGSHEEARRIARELVERRLAACVNIVAKVESVYRWEGKVEEAEEYLLIVKTTEAGSLQIKGAIQQIHSYQVPECIVIAVEDGSLPYLEWISNSVD